MEQQQFAAKRPPLRLSSSSPSQLNNPNNSPSSLSHSPAAASVALPNWSVNNWHSHNSRIAAASVTGGAISVAAPASIQSGYAHLEDAMWQMTFVEEADLAGGPYPERPGEPDCVYYIRTGQCGFGSSCRFNHPANRKLAASIARDKGEYPERVGQQECQYYMKTGSCKFGSTCKFHHPRDVVGQVARVSLNTFGYPLRVGQKECAYYMRTGSCKFGATCKFNHPQPVSTLVAMTGSPIYASNGSPTTPSLQSYPSGVSSWSIPRGPYMPRSRFQSPSSFAPLIVQPQSVVSVPGWNAHQTRMGTVDVQQSTLGGTNIIYGAASSNETPSSGITYVPGSAVTGIPSTAVVSNESAFPERPGQPSCQYYMKTGDCKYGMSCRYNHPKERAVSPTCILSPMGLPLRQGAPQCAFYMQYGMCKYGPTCKFDHPISSLAYSPSASSLTDIPVTPYPVGLSVPTMISWSSETGMAGTKTVNLVANNAENQQGYDDYIDHNGGDTAVPSNTGTGTAGSNRSSSADSIELRGDSNQGASSASS